jgi:hypothetical protein
MLEERRAWCAAHGIKFLFVLAPSKCTVYPEFVPSQYTHISPKSRADQLFAQLKERSKVETLDLRGTIIAAKSRGQLYYKTDTHWNPLGALIGYHALISRLKGWFPELVPVTLNELVLQPNQFLSGDLAGMLGLDDVLKDRYTMIKFRHGESWDYAATPHYYEPTEAELAFKPFATETARKAPKCFFVRDSFLAMPQLFLSENFRRAYFDWSPDHDFPVEVIKREAPDVLVFEIAERHLCGPVPHNPTELQNLARVARFEGSVDQFAK